jgi:rubrerythrin
MYKRLAKVEMEHATVVTKLLGIDRPTVSEESCSDEEKENYVKTVELEDHAATLYSQFAKESSEQRAKLFFTALSQVEAGHIELIKNYL